MSCAGIYCVPQHYAARTASLLPHAPTLCGLIPMPGC